MKNTSLAFVLAQTEFSAIQPDIGKDVKWFDTKLIGKSCGPGPILGIVVRNNAKTPARRGKNGLAAAAAIDYGPLANWIGFNLRMAQESTFQAFSRRYQEIGESPGRFATLTLIGRNPGISQTALSHASGRDKSSLTPVVEGLVRRGLVERRRTSHDRRTYSLNLTADGKKALAIMTRCARQHERNLERIVGPRDRARFLQLLKKIAAEIV